MVESLLSLNRITSIKKDIVLPTFLKGEKKRVSSSSKPASPSFFGNFFWFGGGGNGVGGSIGNEKSLLPSEENNTFQKLAREVVEKLKLEELMEKVCSVEEECLSFLVKSIKFFFEESRKRQRKSGETEASLLLRQKDALLCVHLLTKIVLLNKHRITLLWNDFFTLFSQNLISNKETLEKVSHSVTLHLLLVCVELIHLNVPPLSRQLLPTILHISQLYNSNSTETVCVNISLALLRILNNNKRVLLEREGWETILFLFKLSSNTDSSCENAIKALYILSSSPPSPPPSFPSSPPLHPLHPLSNHTSETSETSESKELKNSSENSSNESEKEVLAKSQTERENESFLLQLLGEEERFQQFLSILELFASVQSKPEVSIDSLKLLYKLFSLIPKLANQLDLHKGKQEKRVLEEEKEEKEKRVWESYWRKMLQIMTKLCKEKRPLIRNQAITFLQKALLSSELSYYDSFKWSNCFEEVLFPFLLELAEMSSPSCGIDHSGLEQTRFRALSLVSKVFLMQLQPTLIRMPHFLQIWENLLLINKLYYQLGSKLLFESVPESLKNTLLVMFDFNILVPDNFINGQNVWSLTWSNVQQFCPNLKADLSLSINPIFSQPFSLPNQPNQLNQPVESSQPPKQRQPQSIIQTNKVENSQENVVLENQTENDNPNHCKHPSNSQIKLEKQNSNIDALGQNSDQQNQQNPTEK